MLVISGCRAAAPLALALVAVCTLAGGRPGTAHAQETVALVAGCNNVALDAPAGTPVGTVAAAIQPAGALTGIFRYDAAARRFLAFSPSAPGSVSDYTTVGALFEPVFICMSAPGVLTRSGAPAALPTPAPAAVAPRGLIFAPGTVRRGDSVEVLIGTLPGYACVGGVNIPIGGSVRFVPVEVVAASNGVAVIHFDTLSSDSPGFALVSVRCADEQFIKVQIQVT